MRIQERVIDRAMRFIATPSESGSETAYQVLFGNELESIGINPIYHQGNTIGFLPGKDKKTLWIMAPHGDTVGPQDINMWANKNPWKPYIQDEKLYGLGACDMKANASACVEMMERIKRNGNVPCDTIVASLESEETDGKGATNFVRWLLNQGHADQYERVALVFPEPTGMVEVMFGNRGHIPLEVIVNGQGGHETNADEINIHPVEAMGQIISSLKIQRKNWAVVSNPAPMVTTTRLSTPEGANNQIAASIRAVVGVRTVPGMHDRAVKIVEGIVYDVVGDKDAYEINKLSETRPAFCDRNSRLIQVMQSLIPGLKVSAFKATTDMSPFMDTLPKRHHAKIQGIIYGAGSLKQAHRYDEFVPVDQVLQFTDLLTQIYYAWTK